MKKIVIVMLVTMLLIVSSAFVLAAESDDGIDAIIESEDIMAPEKFGDNPRMERFGVEPTEGMEKLDLRGEFEMEKLSLGEEEGTDACKARLTELEMEVMSLREMLAEAGMMSVGSKAGLIAESSEGMPEMKREGFEGSSEELARDGEAPIAEASKERKGFFSRIGSIFGGKSASGEAIRESPGSGLESESTGSSVPSRGTIEFSCSDSDGGLDYETKGIVTISRSSRFSTEFEDYCVDAGSAYSIVEYYCDDNRLGEGGGAVSGAMYGCEDGAVVDLEADLSIMDSQIVVNSDDNTITLYVVVENTGDHHTYVPEIEFGISETSSFEYVLDTTADGPTGELETTSFTSSRNVEAGGARTFELVYSGASSEWVSEVANALAGGESFWLDVEVTIDPEDRISETNEDNNYLLTSLTTSGMGIVLI